MPRFSRFLSFLLYLAGSPSIPLLAATLPSDITVLTHEDLLGRNIFSVGDALEGLPSFNIEREGGRGTEALAKVRGGSPNGVIILMDGRALTHEFDGRVDLSQIPINIVDRIEVTRGGSSVSYTGEAESAVVNIVTLRPNSKGFHTRLGTAIGKYGDKHSHGQFFLRNNWADFTYLTSIQEGGGFSLNEDYKGANHFLNISRSFNGKGFWGVEYYFQDSKIGLSEGTPVPLDQWNGDEEKIPFDYYSEQKQESQHVKLYLSYPDIFGGAIHLSLTQSNRDNSIKASPEGLELKNQTNRAQTGQLAWRKNNFEMGAEQQELKREIVSFDNNESRHSSYYALNKWKTGKWTLAPGLRWDDDSEYGGVFVPRLSILMEPEEKFILSLNGQGSYRAPTYDELFIASTTINNTDLKPEKSWTGDAGVEFKASNSADFKVTGFFKETTDLIISNPSTNQWDNRGERETRGIESELKIESGMTTRYLHFKFTANHTAQASRVSLENGEGFVPAALTPDTLAFVRVDHMLPRKMTLANELRYESEQFELPDHQGLRIPGHYVWNLRLKIKVLKADLHFDVENVSRRRYSEGLGNGVLAPQPDRTFWTGITILFDN